MGIIKYQDRYVGKFACYSDCKILPKIGCDIFPELDGKGFLGQTKLFLIWPNGERELITVQIDPTRERGWCNAKRINYFRCVPYHIVQHKGVKLRVDLIGMEAEWPNNEE